MINVIIDFIKSTPLWLLISLVIIYLIVNWFMKRRGKGKSEAYPLQ